ncbi:heparinase [Aquicoccus sp. SCR17]|nr:heparinase [Carideicomes alvinocaridis]
MSNPESWRSRRVRLMHRFHAWLSTRGRPVTGFVAGTEPRSIGAFARGRQLVAGNLMFGGHLIEAPGRMLWDIPPPDPAFETQIHGMTWLDDLAAVGDPVARERAQDWVWGWIARYGRGTGPGWVPELTARRLIRLLHHSQFLLRGRTEADTTIFMRALARQALFLSRRWQATEPGPERFEALTGLIYAGLTLKGMERQVAIGEKALARQCRSQIDAQGGIPSRNPEELLEVFTLLTWTAQALREARRRPSAEHSGAVERIAPTLRTLRHADGSLARFHGGGRGAEGRLDHALAASGVRSRVPGGLSMGYARLSAGRSSIIIDAAAPPHGAASIGAHASTLAFELTSGRRPLIVNCGSGASFGPDWRRAGRATPSHSTLAIEGYSSARLGRAGRIGGARQEHLVDAPQHVPVELSHAEDALRFEGGHDGYVETHGLTHARRLELTLDGRALVGEDMLMALDDAAKQRFDRANEGGEGVAYQIRFHLHPEVDAELDMGGMAVSMALKSGEIWVFRHDGAATLRLEPSVYLERGRLRPRATEQIVLESTARGHASRLRWSLSKAQDTAIAVRDLNREEEEV